MGSEAANDPGERAMVDAYDDLPLWSSLAGALLLEHLPLPRGGRVLDVGCGTGFPLLELADRLGPGALVAGIDPWRPALERAVRKRRARESAAALVLGDAAAVPFRTAAFDLAVSNLGVNNFADAAAALAETARVVRPGGTLALSTNLRGHMREFYEVFAGVLRRLELASALPALEAHIDHRASIDGLRALLADAGFTVTRVEQGDAVLRYAGGQALFAAWFIRLAFLDAWQAILPAPDRDRVLAALRVDLDAIAAREGDLRLTIPLAYIEARR